MINLKKILMYLCVILMLLNCHSVYDAGNTDYHLEIFTLLSIVLVMISLRTYVIDIRALKLSFFWIIYNIPLLIFSSINSNYALTYLCKFILYPIFVFILLSLHQHIYEYMINALVNNVCVIAFVSLFFYFFATIIHFIKPTGMYYINWSPARWVRSYLGIYFEVSPGGYFAYKNSAIFCESTVFGAILCVTLIIEVFLIEDKKYDGIKVFLLCISIITTFSSGSYLVLAICLFGLVLKKYESSIKTNRIIMFSLVVLAAVITVLSLWQLILQKKNAIGYSYLIRLDDYMVAWNVIKEHPFLGMGFGVTDYTRTFMSSQRISTGNFGQSSDLALLIESGGLYFILLYILGFIGLAKMVENKLNRIVFITSLAVIFAVSRIGATVLFVYFISCGVANKFLGNQKNWRENL